MMIFFENMVAHSNKEWCIKVTQPIKFKVLQSLSDIKAWHYGLSCNMNFMVSSLLVTHMSLWVHFLDMVVKDCSLDLIGTLCGKIVWSFPLLGTWTSLYQEVSFIQLFIGFSKPLCFFTLCCEFQEGLLFVSIVLWILDMDKLEMFNFLEDELHIIRIVGLCLETFENIVSKELLQV
jgi:hypothetical protein